MNGSTVLRAEFYDEAPRFRRGSLLDTRLAWCKGLENIEEWCGDQTLIRCGSVRGVRNGVKRAVGQFLQRGQSTRNYEEEDRGKIVIYITSLGVVRRTWERCRRAVAILDNHAVQFERRDLSFDRLLVDELRDRLTGRFQTLPAIFIDGRFFGGLETLEQWTEAGVLRAILDPYKRSCQQRVCRKCYGFRYYPCTLCNGSKKSSVIIFGDRRSGNDIRLKCTQCDSGGLVACGECKDGYVTP